MWTPDADSIASHDTPHPFKLSEVIHTGHRANIFSTKFLPHATHPTIVSCAGDSQIRVYDVERLDRVNVQQRQELDGDTGPGYDCAGTQCPVIELMICLACEYSAATRTEPSGYRSRWALPRAQRIRTDPICTG